MKTHLNDEQLRRLVRESWTVSPAADPAFRAAVWARIEARRLLPATWKDWLKLHLVGVTTSAAASIVLAGMSGGWLAASQADREREQLLRAYVTSIDPHQRVMAEGAP